MLICKKDVGGGPETKDYLVVALNKKILLVAISDVFFYPIVATVDSCNGPA